MERGTVIYASHTARFEPRDEFDDGVNIDGFARHGHYQGDALRRRQQGHMGSVAIEVSMTVIDTDAATDVVRRMRAEFEELPGMRLTFEQVARLLTVDDITCASALYTLVLSGYLTKQGCVYRRATGDRRDIAPSRGAER